jgi:hypothetical protein
MCSSFREEDDDLLEDDDDQDVEDLRGIGVWVATADEELDGIVEDEELANDEEDIEREITELMVDEDYVLTDDNKNLESRAPKHKTFLCLDEFRAFLGLWYMRGLYSQASTKLANLYQSDHIPVFSAVMPRKR